MKISFSPEQILNRIRFENPWWENQGIEPYYAEMKRREYFTLFFPLVQEISIKRAVVVMGPRRVGKTVMLFHAIEELIKTGVNPTNICYFSVETPIYNGIPLEELVRYFFEINSKTKNDRLFIFFDEIQYLKNWEVHLKSLVDSYHNIKFIVSGSAAAALKLKSIESGAGRFTDFALPPLTFHEYMSLKNITGIITETSVTRNFKGSTYNTISYECENMKSLNRHFFNYINFGGYPEVSLSETIQSDPGRYIRNDIIDKVLLRDLPVLYGIEDIQELNSLFTYIAYHSGSEMSLDGIASSSGVSKNTIKKYITYLEAAYLIMVIQRIDNSGKKFKRANFFKIYLTNPSLRSALFAPIDENDSIAGNMVETAVFSQWQHDRFSDLYYARWKDGEVDIVDLDEKEKPAWAVEVKWSNKCYNDYTELKNLVSFCRSHHLKNGTITTYDVTGKKIIDEVEVEFRPTALYCYAVGKNLVLRK